MHINLLPYGGFHLIIFQLSVFIAGQATGARSFFLAVLLQASSQLIEIDLGLSKDLGNK